MADSLWYWPPSGLEGMTELDRSKFHQEHTIKAVRIRASDTELMQKDPLLKGHILQWPGLKSVEPDPGDPKGKRLLLLNKTESTLPPDVKDHIADKTFGWADFKIRLDYDFWSAKQILEAALPTHLHNIYEGVPTSFTHTGHIGHFNLREEFLPYKYLIGQVTLDKNKILRTVVNKLETIDTEFRTFQMEVIAGEPDFNVVVNESDCAFAFDFSKVYWNSRLQGEHKRLIDMFQPGEVIADVFAGVGPFAIPAAKKGCFVLANDLNPDSVSSLRGNAERNKVEERLRASCSDGRLFIKDAATQIWNNPIPYSDPAAVVRKREKEARRAREKNPEAQPPPAPENPPRRRIDHFVMNLPATAIEFIDAFRGILKPIRDQDPKSFEEVYGDKMPTVHCHCFHRGPQEGGWDSSMAWRDLRKTAEERLGGTLGKDWDEVNYHYVRNVSPHKHMFCISFPLPKVVALADAVQSSE